MYQSLLKPLCDPRGMMTTVSCCGRPGWLILLNNQMYVSVHVILNMALKLAPFKSAKKHLSILF